MIALIFATGNAHKAQEVQSILSPHVEVLTLEQLGIQIDIPEPYETLQENAAQKSRVIKELTGKNCFGEDTGLEVFELGGKPGVLSARYAGPERNSCKNVEKLLHALSGCPEREARFRTFIALNLEGNEYFFEGISLGKIALSPRGSGGFGYDSIFIPDGSERTFAEMTPTEKNVFSHRRKATDKFAEFLLKYYGKS